MRLMGMLRQHSENQTNFTPVTKRLQVVILSFVTTE